MRLASFNNRSSWAASPVDNARCQSPRDFENCSSAASRLARLVSMICRHNAGSPAAMRVVSCHPLAVSVTYSSGVALAMAAATRCGRWLVAANARSCSSADICTTRDPRLVQNSESTAAGVGRRTFGGCNHYGSADKQIGHGKLWASFFIARQGVAANEMHALAPCGRRSRTLELAHDLQFRAARVGKQCARAAQRGKLEYLLGDVADWRQTTTKSASDMAVFASEAILSIAPSCWAVSNVAGREPVPTTFLANWRLRTARPTDPPISPTPTIATQSQVFIGQLFDASRKRGL